jgi:GT2 family glycosyltransferase
VRLMPRLFQADVGALGDAGEPTDLAQLDAIYPGGFGNFALRFARRHAGLRISQVNSACVAIRRELVEDLGGFDEAFESTYFTDLDFFVRARLNRRYNHVYQWPGVLVHHAWSFTLRDAASDRRLELDWERFLRKWQDQPRAMEVLAELQDGHLVDETQLQGSRR